VPKTVPVPPFPITRKHCLYTCYGGSTDALWYIPPISPGVRSIKLISARWRTGARSFCFYGANVEEHHRQERRQGLITLKSMLVE
jgi:hypothetical protein